VPFNAQQRGELPWGGALLVFLTLVPSTIVIPVVRRLVTEQYPGAEGLVYAFVAINLAGACLGGPLLAVAADRLARRRTAGIALAAVDGLMALALSVGLPAPLMLTARFVQGAASVGAVSLFMGSIRSKAKTSAAMGLVASSVIVALVVSIPLGAVLGREIASRPLLVGGILGLVAAALAPVLFPPSWEQPKSGRSLHALWRDVPALRLPVLAVALERLGVGAFVVTLQMYAHHVLKVGDGVVSRWFTLFLALFALATWPFARLGDRLARASLVGVGAVVYGLALVALGLVPERFVGMLLCVGAIGAGAIYGPALGLVGECVDTSMRSSAMGLLNASGTFGMFVGNAMAGAVATILLDQGMARQTVYAGVFAAAGLTQACFGLVTIVRARQMRLDKWLAGR
jgi:MFS family permease